jgi:hypothetical protein
MSKSKHLQREVGNEGSANIAARAPLDVAAERRVLGELVARREAQLHRKVELESERKTHAFAAHVEGNAEAGKLLSRAIDEALRLDQHLASLDDAIAEQQRRVAAAETVAAKQADRQLAVELRDTCIEFLQAARQLDGALAAVAEHGHRLHLLQEQMHRLGAAVPSAAQLDSLGYRSLLTAVSAGPWHRHFETLAPHERRSFAALCAIWVGTIERNIAARLGEAEPTATAPEVAA